MQRSVVLFINKSTKRAKQDTYMVYMIACLNEKLDNCLVLTLSSLLGILGIYFVERFYMLDYDFDLKFRDHQKTLLGGVDGFEVGCPDFTNHI